MALSIRTRYNGVRFRSKLEADYARFFDAIGCPWQYEHEGAYYGDVFYLPDFFLPRSRQYVEVKGKWEPDDCRKILALLQHSPPRRYTDDDHTDVPVIAANPDGVFWGFSRRRRGGPVPGELESLLLDNNHAVVLAQCGVCQGWWFLVEADGWRCQCCGAADGRRHITDVLTSPIAPWPVEGKRVAS